MILTNTIHLEEKPVPNTDFKIYFEKAFEEFQSKFTYEFTSFWFKCKNKKLKHKDWKIALSPDKYDIVYNQIFNQALFIEITKSFFNNLKYPNIKNSSHVSQYINFHYKDIADKDKSMFLNYIDYVFRKLPAPVKLGTRNQEAFRKWMEKEKGSYASKKSEYAPAKEVVNEPETKYHTKRRALFIETFKWMKQLSELENLYSLLTNEKPYIKASGGKEEFKKAFGAEKSEFTGTPNIKWLRYQRTLACMMGALIELECIPKNTNYAKIIEETECIVDNHGKKYKAINLRNAKSQAEKTGSEASSMARRLVQKAISDQIPQ